MSSWIPALRQVYSILIRTDRKCTGVAASIVGLVALLTALLGTPSHKISNYYQNTFAPAVLLSCHGVFANVDTNLHPRLKAFLDRDVHTLECGEVPDGATANLQKVTLFQEVHQYLLKAFAYTWRLTGLTWDAAFYIAAGLFLFFSLSAFFLMRLVASPIVAMIWTLLFVLSDRILNYVSQIRDFSKAPFMLFILYGSCLALIHRGSIWTYSLMGGVLGLVCGWGLGFRVDLLMFLGLFVLSHIVAIVFLPNKQILSRLSSIAFYILGWSVLGTRILSALWGTNNGYHGFLLGLVDEFSQVLRVSIPPYSWGLFFMDDHIFSLVSATYQEALGGTPEFYKYSASYWNDIVQTFPADLLTRFWAAVAETMRQGFLGRWNALLFVAAGLLFWIRKPLYAFCFFGLVILMSGYGFFQFQPRHNFHMTIVPYFCAAALMAFGLRSADWVQLNKRKLWLFTGVSLVFLLVGAGILSGLRFYQKQKVTQRIQQWLNFDYQPATYKWSEENTTATLQLSVESLTLVKLSLRSSEQCSRKMVPLTYFFQREKESPAVFNQKRVDLSQNSAEVIFPYYNYKMGIYGLKLERQDVPCVKDIQWARKPETVKSLVWLNLPSNWMSLDLFQRRQPLVF